ncbi:peptidase S41-like protein [Kribbella amoyensis]|uniref:Peptidase S41-like protein n=1 Tax=Kribbella amoyensis TaxID=996641 RepID=A0A561BX76_9ACTN|nr:S41 family peptidase [Kribbella amoyensis]TWD83494.1 peptidase S41-like protein [Kribbella amoyensis]
MRTDEIRTITDRLAALVAVHYVFPEVGQKVAARLAAASAAGRYDELTEPEQLAERVTADLQEGNLDKHLRLKYNREEVPDEADPAAEEAYWLGQARLHAGGMARAERLPGNIGVLEIRPILYPPQHAAPAVSAAMSLLSATYALIVDLRGCIGGSPDQVAYLCSHLVGSEPVHLNDLVTPADGTVRQFWTTPALPGPRYGGTKPIWVLTSAATFSGGEELAYNLQTLGRATVVGERTGGGAHPRRGFSLHPNLEATIPVQRSINPLTGTNWEGVGVWPQVDVAAADAFDEARRRAVEYVLALPPGSGRSAAADELRPVAALRG